MLRAGFEHIHVYKWNYNQIFCLDFNDLCSFDNHNTHRNGDLIHDLALTLTSTQPSHYIIIPLVNTIIADTPVRTHTCAPYERLIYVSICMHMYQHGWIARLCACRTQNIDSKKLYRSPVKLNYTNHYDNQHTLRYAFLTLCEYHRLNIPPDTKLPQYSYQWVSTTLAVCLYIHTAVPMYTALIHGPNYEIYASSMHSYLHVYWAMHKCI